MGYDAASRVSAVLEDVEARRVVDRLLPGVLESPVLEHLRFATLGVVVALTPTIVGAPEIDRMWEALAALPSSPPPPRPEEAVPSPSTGYESESVARGSAAVRPVSPAAQWGVAEVVIDGPSHGNSFVEVELTAAFTGDDGSTIRVGGFFDGGGMYRIRFQPPTAGTWHFETASNARSLDGLTGAIQAAPPADGNHGPVQVADRFHFAHRDGTRHVPIGTTVYALVHQTEALEQRTLATLASAGFRKVRLCVFPKSYLFNANEPLRYPFPKREDGSWDTTRFEPAFFQHLERRIEDLAALGVETDLILFHAYDRWGFSELGADANERYVRYLVRRLAAYPSVWWSLANEYDLLPDITTDDWERIATVIAEEDHVGHLTSIHNCFGFYDHARPWITHVSAQRIDMYRTAEDVDAWRERWGKPVIVDECAYEGDIDQGWGNISGRELTRRFWEGAVRGGYIGHGETYLNDREELWWSKGGELVGESPERIRFLLQVLDAVPGGVLEPLPSDWDARWGGTDDVRIAYLGFGRPRYRDVVLPPGRGWRIDVIDTWGCTIEPLPGVHTGRVRIPLPARESMAIRLTAEETA